MVAAISCVVKSSASSRLVSQAALNKMKLLDVASKPVPVLLFWNCSHTSRTYPSATSILVILGYPWAPVAVRVKAHSLLGSSILQIPILSPFTKGQFSTVLILFCNPIKTSLLFIPLSIARASPSLSTPWNTGFCFIRRWRLTLSNCFKYLAGSSKSTSQKSPSVIKTGKILLPPSANIPVWIGSVSLAVRKSSAVPQSRAAGTVPTGL